MPTFGSLFAGIGGMDLGLERAGWECRWQVEIDEYRRRILAKHWPDAIRYGDIREVTEIEPVDLICGGFPCQPVSFAGRGLAQADSRWLWPEFHRVVRLVRPRFVLVENVPGLLGRGLGDVLGDLAASGYDAEWDCIPAAAVGAPHLRYRVFIVAYPQSNASCSDTDGLRPHRAEVNELGGSELRHEQERQSRSVGTAVADPKVFRLERAGGTRNGRSGLADGGWWAVEPPVGRMADGFPGRVEQIRGLGDSVVPQVAEWIGQRLMEVA